MANTINSANMLMPIPVVGTDPGPDYATDINSCLTILDGHNHSPGYGVAIPSDGLNINSDLTFNNSNATNVKSIRFQIQGSPLATASDIGCIYESGVDLYYNDGNGNQIQITSGGALAGTPGSISGLVSPASASYVALSSTFVWQSASLTPAIMDAASYIFRNLAASSKGLTLQPPAAMAADYIITLPTLPASQKFLTLDASGVMAASWAPDNATLTVSSNLLKVANAGIGTTQLADGSVTAAKLAANVSTVLQRVAYTTAGTHTFTPPADVTSVIVTARGGSGGGGAGNKQTSSGFQGGGGGGGAISQTVCIPVTPSTPYTLTIGAKGTGGVGRNTNGGGANGTDGADTSFGSVWVFKGALGGKGGGGTQLGVGGYGLPASGGTGGTDVVNATDGYRSPFAPGGASSGATDDGGGGGGGDGAGGAGGVAGPSGTSGSNGTLGGGGGGGGPTSGSNSNFSGSGGDGTDGAIVVSYVSGSP